MASLSDECVKSGWAPTAGVSVGVTAVANRTSGVQYSVCHAQPLVSHLSLHPSMGRGRNRAHCETPLRRAPSTSLSQRQGKPKVACACAGSPPPTGQAAVSLNSPGIYTVAPPPTSTQQGGRKLRLT